MSKITQFPATSTQYNVWWYTSNWRLLLFYNAALNAIGHFRVPPGLCIKTMLSARPLICKWFFNLMRIKLIFTRKVVHLEPHIESEGFWNSEMAYCPSNRVFFFQNSIANVKWTVADFFEETRDLLTSFELAGLNALHVRSTLHQKYNFLSLELARAVFRE